jgi:hypothetical protein
MASEVTHKRCRNTDDIEEDANREKKRARPLEEEDEVNDPVTDTCKRLHSALRDRRLVLKKKSRLSAECITRVLCAGRPVLGEDLLQEVCNRYETPTGDKIRIAVYNVTRLCSCVVGNPATSKGRHQPSAGQTFVEGLTIVKGYKRRFFEPYVITQYFE